MRPALLLLLALLASTAVKCADTNAQENTQNTESTDEAALRSFIAGEVGKLRTHSHTKSQGKHTRTHRRSKRSTHAQRRRTHNTTGHKDMISFVENLVKSMHRKLHRSNRMIKRLAAQQRTIHRLQRSIEHKKKARNALREEARKAKEEADEEEIKRIADGTLSAANASFAKRGTHTRRHTRNTRRHTRRNRRYTHHDLISRSLGHKKQHKQHNKQNSKQQQQEVAESSSTLEYVPRIKNVDNSFMGKVKSYIPMMNNEQEIDGRNKLHQQYINSDNTNTEIAFDAQGAYIKATQGTQAAAQNTAVSTPQITQPSTQQHKKRRSFKLWKNNGQSKKKKIVYNDSISKFTDYK